MDPYDYINSRAALYKNYDPMQEARIQYMYDLATKNPQNASLANAYNQSYMEYMYPQSDPLMEALGGGGEQYDSRQFSTPTLQNYAGGDSVTQDQLNMYRQQFGLGNDWKPEDISIEVPDQPEQGGAQNALNFGGAVRTALTPFAEPVALAANVAGNMAAGRNLGESVDQGTRDWMKDFQKNNIFGNIGTAVAGDSAAKMSEIPLGQQADQFRESVNQGRIPGLYHLLKANESMNNLMGSNNPGWGETYNNIWGGLGSDRKWDYKSTPREGYNY